MLDLFTIFSKGGIVLWCFQGTEQIFTSSVNALIRNVILQERTGVNTFDHDGLSLQYKLDNEFDLVFVVGYQKILQLSYVDKFLNDIHLEYRDKYKNELTNGQYFNGFDFMDTYNSTLRKSEEWSKLQANKPKQMRSFEESLKSKKTVSSMIERKGEEKPVKNVKKKEVNFATEEVLETISPPQFSKPVENGTLDEETLAANRAKLAKKMQKKKTEVKKIPKSPPSQKAGKKPRVWDLGGTNKDLQSLERTTDKFDDMKTNFTPDTEMVGQMKGVIKDLEVESSDEEYSDEEEPEQQNVDKQPSKPSKGGMFSIFKSLVGSKNLTKNDMTPVLEKMKDHLIAKNVAADIAYKLCDSVAAKLEGKVLGTFESVASTVKNTLTESLVQILSPKRRVDILRDCMEAQKHNRPYVMAFCGVNGVGKSTNLAKICFWLIENNMRVLIAACDTFRAGAVEQLRTHMRHLNALHPPDRHAGMEMVQLYEKGYGKDAAGIAMEAIRYANDSRIDVVLIDTAGRMQDNEPLMRALTKLIKVNEPDLVLFVGEALVGNEAVDQLVKFNQALADYSSNTNPHIIDGIVLTKFDTIDDKLFRHGDRAPTLSYPNDPYFDEKYWPMGIGQLTNKGKKRQYDLGRWLRRTYHDFLPELYIPNDIYVYSTNVDRTLMSAASNLAGLYPPVDSQIWKVDLDWQPIPVHTAPLLKDVILRAELKCPKYDKLLDELSNSEFFININNKYSQLYQQLSKFTGWNVTDTYYVSVIVSTFHAYSHHNASYIPSWYNTLDRNATEYLTALEFMKSSFTPELSKLSGGIFFYKIFQHFDHIINGTDSVKLLMYSGHDISIAKILNIMKVFNYKVPEYASMVIFELYHKDLNYYINVLYKQNETYVEKLTLGECEFNCEYSLFKRYLEPIILHPHDQKQACSVED